MEIKSIFIADSRAVKVYESLKNAFPHLEVILADSNMEVLPETDAYIGFGPTKDFTNKKYKWVHCLGAGVDRFINEGNLDSSTILTRTINQFGYQIASFCLSFMLNVEQKLYEYQELQRKNEWKRIGKGSIRNKKVVIFGTGQIGKDIAKMLKFMETYTVGVSRSGGSVEFFDEIYKIEDVKEALVDADWIINILPLTAETEEIFNKDIFSVLQDANFINVGRGRTVNEDDLLEAMNNNNINYAVLDVQAVEPLSPDSPLYLQEKLIITPHISGIPDIDNSGINVLKILNQILNDEELDSQVDLSKQY